MTTYLRFLLHRPAEGAVYEMLRHGRPVIVGSRCAVAAILAHDPTILAMVPDFGNVDGDRVEFVPVSPRMQQRMAEADAAEVAERRLSVEAAAHEMLRR